MAFRVAEAIEAPGQVRANALSLVTGGDLLGLALKRDRERVYQKTGRISAVKTLDTKAVSSHGAPLCSSGAG